MPSLSQAAQLLPAPRGSSTGVVFAEARDTIVRQEMKHTPGRKKE